MEEAAFGLGQTRSREQKVNKKLICSRNVRPKGSDLFYVGHVYNGLISNKIGGFVSFKWRDFERNRKECKSKLKPEA